MSLDRQKARIQCPSCRRTMQPIYRDILSRRKVKCICGSVTEFSSSAVSRFRTALNELRRAQDKVEKAEQDLLDGAKVVAKRR